MSKVRVLEIISGFAIEGPLGGIERFGIELAQALDRSTIEPIVCGMWSYATPYEQNWVAFLQDHGIDAFIAAPWQESHPTASFWNAYKGVKQRNLPSVDIIHSHCQFGDVLALLLKRPLKAKALVRTVHNEREWAKRPLRRLLLTNGLYPWRFDCELGVAQKVVDNLDQRLVARFLKQRAIRGYNALNLNRFTHMDVNLPAKRQSLGIPSAAPVIGSIGRLTEQKGYGVLLAAVPQILRNIPDAFFLIVGTGELEESLHHQVQEYGLNNRVIFTGARPDVEELLAVMDVFVNSSLWEGLPTVIMESMAAGVPVVATQVAGNLELIQPGETGLLVPAHDAPALAEAIIQLLTMPELIKAAMVARARRFVEEHFSITAVAHQHDHLYQQLSRPA
jgi:glycosyltransferase involved in cell wall biosynthesis